MNLLCVLQIVYYNIRSKGQNDQGQDQKIQKGDRVTGVSYAFYRFSEFFHHWKEEEISNKLTYYFPPHLKYIAALPAGIQKIQICRKIAK